MHLKEAREKMKIPHLIMEHGKTHLKASKRHFHAVLKSMAMTILLTVVLLLLFGGGGGYYYSRLR